jgi:DNA-3-methyladenine glycosylase II
MSKAPSYWIKAKKYLSKKDKVMSSLIKKYKSPSETVLTSRRDVFFSLCKSIIGQQISVAAANSVFLKFKKKCKNKINAKTVNKLSSSQLKSCGLSRQKVKGIKSLAKKVLNKEFTYNRPNIWPIQDIGLLRAISKNFNKKYLPPESYITYLNKKFSPYCSVATWYLWRSIDPEPIQY